VERDRKRVKRDGKRVGIVRWVGILRKWVNLRESLDTVVFVSGIVVARGCRCSLVGVTGVSIISLDFVIFADGRHNCKLAVVGMAYFPP